MTQSAKPLLRASWVHLAMLNYEVEAAALKSRVPEGTELDSWNGRCLVSMVGFQFLNTRVLGISVPMHTDFDEVNLRFYVRREVADEIRRGVVFVKEIVPRAAIAWAARRLYNENYVALKMAHDDRLSEQSDRRLAYRWWLEGSLNEISVRPDGAPYLPTRGSEEEFISEHYWGYVRQRNGSTLEYRVEHPQWEVLQAVDAGLRCDTARLYGQEFESTLSRPPSSAFIALGSPVVVRRAVPLRPEATDT